MSGLRPTDTSPPPDLVVKNQLIEKLIEENRKILSELNRVQENGKTETLRLKRDAARVMEKLIGDNAWYRDQNAALQRRLEGCEALEKRAREQLVTLGQERDGSDHEKRVLGRYLDSLREQKNTLEFQAKHLGAAFLTLRECVLNYVMNPVALESETIDQSWEERVETPQFQAAVIETIQATARLRVTAEAIDSRLIGLRLLDAVALSGKRILRDKDSGMLRLMGEKLVPIKEVIQLKKERQMWQRRYIKCQEELAQAKAKNELFDQKLSEKSTLLRKAQAHQSTLRTADTIRSSLRIQNSQLQTEVDTLKSKYSESLKLLQQTRLAAAPIPVVSRAASNAFLSLGRESDISRQVPSVKPEEKPRRASSRRISSPIPNDIPNIVKTPSRQLSESKSPRTVRSPSMTTLVIPGSSTTPPPRMDETKSQNGADDNDRPFSEISRKPSKRVVGTTVRQSEYLSPIAREIHGLEKANESHTESREPSLTPSPVTLRLASSFLEGPTTPTAFHNVSLTPPARQASQFLGGSEPASDKVKLLSTTADPLGRSITAVPSPSKIGVGVPLGRLKNKPSDTISIGSRGRTSSEISQGGLSTTSKPRTLQIGQQGMKISPPQKSTLEKRESATLSTDGEERKLKMQQSMSFLSVGRHGAIMNFSVNPYHNNYCSDLEIFPSYIYKHENASIFQKHRTTQMNPLESSSSNIANTVNQLLSSMDGSSTPHRRIASSDLTHVLRMLQDM